MELHYTLHAEQRLAKRQLRKEWVERTVAAPALILPDEGNPALEHRLAAIPELAGRVLRVIVSRQAPHRVITAHLDRTMKGKL